MLRKRGILFSALWVCLLLRGVAVAEEQSQRELELNWKVLTGSGTYSAAGEKSPLPSSGFMIEMYPGYKIRSIPGLDYGLSASFLMLAGGTTFSRTSGSGTLAYQQSWDVTTNVFATALMAKYGYHMDLGKIGIGIENGLGMMYSLTHESYDWTHAEDSAVTGSGSSDTREFGPIIDANIKVNYALGEFNRIGLNAGGILGIFKSGGYENIFTVAIGLNYQVTF